MKKGLGLRRAVGVVGVVGVIGMIGVVASAMAWPAQAQSGASAPADHAGATAPSIAGFASMAWGDPIAKLGPADALPLVERPGQPYEPCFRRTAETLDFAGVALGKVTWCFYDGGLSYVSLASDQPTAFAGLRAAFAARYGPPRSSGPNAATWGAGPDGDPDGATASLFETRKTPGALLMMLSNRTKLRKAQALEAAAAASSASR